MNWKFIKTILQLVVMVSIMVFIVVGIFIKTDKETLYVDNYIKAGGSPIMDYLDNNIYNNHRRCVKTDSLVDIPN
jgi:hypothetical protein